MLIFQFSDEQESKNKRCKWEKTPQAISKFISMKNNEKSQQLLPGSLLFLEILPLSDGDIHYSALTARYT